jgi:hypothetical protein
MSGGKFRPEKNRKSKKKNYKQDDVRMEGFDIKASFIVYKSEKVMGAYDNPVKAIEKAEEMSIDDSEILVYELIYTKSMTKIFSYEKGVCWKHEQYRKIGKV